MRLPVVLTGLVLGATFFVTNTGSAHAQSQTNPTVEEPKTVQIQPGDYLAKIAAENNTTYPRLYDANLNIKDPDVIYPGDSLRVPKPDEQLTPRTPPTGAPDTTPDSAAQATAPKPRAVSTRPAAPVTYSGDATVWDRLAACESGGNWSINTGNGFYGGLQFTLGSWHGVGGSGYPNEASREEQIARAEILLSRQGWGAWPACSAKLGLR